MGKLTITSIPQSTGTFRPALRGFSLPGGFSLACLPLFVLYSWEGLEWSNRHCSGFLPLGGGVPHPEFLATVFRVCTVLRVLSWVSRDFLPLFGVLAHFWPLFLPLPPLPSPSPGAGARARPFPDDLQTADTRECRAADGDSLYADRILGILSRVG